MATDQIAQWKAEAARLRDEAVGLSPDIRDDLLSIAERYDLLIMRLEKKYAAHLEKAANTDPQ